VATAEPAKPPGRQPPNLGSPIVGSGGYWPVAANGATHACGAPEDGMFPDLGAASRPVAIAPG
jgi:hypothetical protein